MSFDKLQYNNIKNERSNIEKQDKNNFLIYSMALSGRETYSHKISVSFSLCYMESERVIKRAKQ